MRLIIWIILCTMWLLLFVCFFFSRYCPISPLTCSRDSQSLPTDIIEDWIVGRCMLKQLRCCFIHQLCDGGGDHNDERFCISVIFIHFHILIESIHIEIYFPHRNIIIGCEHTHTIANLWLNIPVGPCFLHSSVSITKIVHSLVCLNRVIGPNQSKKKSNQTNPTENHFASKIINLKKNKLKGKKKIRCWLKTWLDRPFKPYVS